MKNVKLADVYNTIKLPKKRGNTNNIKKTTPPKIIKK